MDLEGLSARSFRARLATELPKWEAEGLISAESATTLRARYHLDEDGTSAATIAIYVLGSLLVGGGVISFVAWNWAALPAAVKLLLINGLLVGTHWLGFHLRDVRASRPALGHGLLFLGSLIFGANIGLVAQIFHVESNWFNGFGGWAAGTFAAALIYGSLPTAALSLITFFVYACGVMEDHLSLWAMALPLLMIAAYGTLTWIHRSRALFVLLVLGTSVLTLWFTGESSEATTPVLTVYSCIAMFLIALPSAVEGGALDRLASWSGRMGLSMVAFLAYLLSFTAVAEEVSEGLGSVHEWAWLGLVAPFAAAATWALFRGRSHRLISWVGISGALGLTASSFVDNGALLFLFIAHATLLGLVVAAIQSSLETLRRGPFWAGSLLGVAVILSRFLEFDTGLLAKALIFTVCGLGVIAVGVAFERRRKQEGAQHA